MGVLFRYCHAVFEFMYAVFVRCVVDVLHSLAAGRVRHVPPGVSRGVYRKGVR